MIRLQTKVFFLYSVCTVLLLLTDVCQGEVEYHVETPNFRYHIRHPTNNPPTTVYHTPFDGYYHPRVRYVVEQAPPPPPPTVEYRYRPAVVQPVRAVAAYQDDNVYITDQYGRTTVQSGAAYRLQSQQRSAYATARARYTAISTTSTTCTSSTCGQNAHCTQAGDGRPVCSCLPHYIGDPLHHCRRAECIADDDCHGHQRCDAERCVDPCLGACGTNADCETRNHIPTCSCPPGYTGHPATHCRRFDPEELCHPSPCGTNTQCEIVNGHPTCKCLPGYHGSPLAGCRHECETSSECGPNLACIEFKCQNPCPIQCGTNAECDGVRNNAAVCKCPRGYYGNPYSSCQAECTSDGDCPRHKPACYQNSCKNPCDGVCGVNANCELTRGVVPTCSCPKEMTGDPFVRCRPFEKRDLCVPNPCGANAQCQPGYDKHNQERPVCTCLPGHQGDAIKGCVRGECIEDSQCADHQACINYHCTNPCVGKCGSNADCMARHHIAVCTCPPGFNGDALFNCYRISESRVSRRYYRHIVMDQIRQDLETLAQMQNGTDDDAPAVTDKSSATPPSVIVVTDKSNATPPSVEAEPEVTAKSNVSPPSAPSEPGSGSLDLVRPGKSAHEGLGRLAGPASLFSTL